MSNRLPELLRQYPEIELIELGNDMPTSEKAAEMCGLDLSSIAKTLIIKTEKDFAALIFLRGSDRVNEKSVKVLLNCKKFRFATSDETLAVTSYPAGGIPPIGLGPLISKVLLDRKVLENEWVIAGGGDRPNSLKYPQS